MATGDPINPINPASPADAAIEGLHLAVVARKAAYLLKQKFPAVKFTSGRRAVADQARAMASNICLPGQRQWIVHTYKYSPLRERCQRWVDTHPAAVTRDPIAAGLLSVFDEATPAEIAAFSFHLSGMAFDVQPIPGAAQVKAAIHSLPGCTQFLDYEGGLERWHAEFRE